MKILIKNGHIIDPSRKFDRVCDIYLVNDKIKKIGRNLKIIDKNIKIFDATNKFVFPGLVDIHTHLREPGFEGKETIATGSRAAAKGGVTSVCCMPNTNPVLDNLPSIEYVVLKSEKESLVNVYPIGCITKKQEGKVICEIGTLIDGGILAVSDDGNPVMDSFIMAKALEYCKTFDIPVVSHCEDLDLVNNGVMNEGEISMRLGLAGIPNAAEEVMVSRDIILAESTGGYLHIAHISTKGSVNLVRDAKRRGVNITCETTPHYFTLTQEAVLGYNTNAKMNPPLRTNSDVMAIIEGLKDGTIDAIASDHAPHTIEEKNREFDLAPFGIIGLETELALAYTELVLKAKMDISTVIKKLTINPAKIMRIENRGSLQVGNFADVIIFDPNKKFRVGDYIASKSSNTPFLDWELQGVVDLTIVNGKVVWQNGEFI
ncbi:MAG: dihydroorotase [Elusimicrobiota bacterium]|jgi:dihydroorotase|nr:dihydroorotase [Elusimicrobiota bacterium]